jgi:hypothetical protein
MDKINSLIPDNKSESTNTNNETPSENEETTIHEVFQSLKRISSDVREALEDLNRIKNDKNLSFLEGLERSVEESGTNIGELAKSQIESLTKRAFELLKTTGEEEINEFAEHCGISLEFLGLRFPKSSESVTYNDWSSKTVRLETITGDGLSSVPAEGGDLSSVTAEGRVDVSSWGLSNVYTGFNIMLETKPLDREKIGSSVEFRINGKKDEDGSYSMDYAVISFMDTKKKYPDMDILDTDRIGQVVIKPDGSLLSVVTWGEKGSKHTLSTDPDFRDSLIELEGILGGHGVYIDRIPPVIDIAESFNNIARGHMGGERLVSVVPKNLFKYEGGLLKDNGDFDWNGKIRNLLRYDLSRRSDYFNDIVGNPESMLNIEFESLKAELKICVDSTKFLDGNLSPDNGRAFLSWMSSAFYNETGRDITTTPVDTEGLSKTEQDLVSLFNTVKSKFADKPKNSE